MRDQFKAVLTEEHPQIALKVFTWSKKLKKKNGIRSQIIDWEVWTTFNLNCKQNDTFFIFMETNTQ